MLKIIKKEESQFLTYADILRKRPKKKKLRGGQEVPMDIDKINASLAAANPSKE